MKDDTAFEVLERVTQIIQKQEDKKEKCFKPIKGNTLHKQSY